MTLQDLLEESISLNASDIHITQDLPVAYKVDGKTKIMTDEEHYMFQQYVTNIVDDLTHSARTISKLYAPADIDGTYVYRNKDEEEYYFRFNICLAKGVPHITIRKLINKVPSIEEIKMNEGDGAKFFNECLKMQEGLYLVIGATSSGKSTTLTCVVDALLKAGGKKAVTLEAPIEYFYEPLDYEPYDSIIIQRDIGMDTASFDLGLRAAMRQAPDIILVGEIRDKETASSALQAANTGHVVLATLHAASVELAVERLRFLVGGITNDFSFVKAIMSQKLVFDEELGKRKAIRKCKTFKELFPEAV